MKASLNYLLSGQGISPKAENFQDLVSDLKENLLKIAFLMLQTPKFFACGADLPLLLE